MFFALGNALLDASIAVWECKREFDFARSITAIRFLYGGKPVRAWAGPGLGTRLIRGEQFRSYIATPPFAEYVSGHSAFSAASAEILASLTGHDAFAASVTFPAGSSRIEPSVTPQKAVTLSYGPRSRRRPTRRALSHRYGGIHFESGDLAARTLGRRVGGLVWDKVQQYVSGTATATW